ncbi:hypothetical protein, partial [Nostoc edaphicum]|uniref:hypothetical protein n=1 Tax=Nostoc edaphicum TaxID=264686 RepID=UPI001D1576C9
NLAIDHRIAFDAELGICVFSHSIVLGELQKTDFPTQEHSDTLICIYFAYFLGCLLLYTC